MTAVAATNLETKVMTGKVRFSFAHVFVPVSIDGVSEPKYSLCLLIPKSDSVTLNKIKLAIDAAKVAGTAKLGGKIPANLKTPLRDGDVERPDSPEYKDMMFVNANSKTKPGIVDRDRVAIEDTTEIYSGCYGRVTLSFYAYATAGSKGIACGLNNIQKLSDGDYLGGRSRAEDDFNDDEFPADANDLLG